MKYAVYDIEILRNLFTVCFLDYQSKSKKEFVLFDTKKELKTLTVFLKQLQKHDYVLVGFNSLNFDSQLLEFILSNHEIWLESDDISIEYIISEIYNKAQDLINLPDDEKWKVIIPEWKLSISQIDLFKQKHYDGMAKKGTSLKWIQFSMRYPNVEEMPIEHDETVSKKEIPLILSYNWNDVLSTEAFFTKNKFETDLRYTLSEKYNLGLLNASEPRLAKMIFGKFLCEDMDISNKQLRDMRTFRKHIKLKSIIFPYINFKTPILQAVLAAINQVNLNLDDKDNFKYNFNYGAISTDIGLGGIHACCKSGVYEETETWNIEDIDVISFYPNLAIKNGVKPQHLGNSFSKIYNNFFEERQKIPKSDPINYIYKIILNSTYGLSKEVNNYLYDPLFTYTITINGQLSLLMLIESLVENIPGLKIYQENTDGVSIGYDIKYTDKVKQLCAEWKELTKLDLEHSFYKKMIIRDVNNYIAIKRGFDWNEYQTFVKNEKRKEYGYIKRKGVFDLDLDYHKNPSFSIIPMAAEAYFLGNVDYRDFIRNNRNIYDFLAATKRKKNFKLNLYTTIDGKVNIESQQKVTRLYVSTSGGTLVKDFTDNRKVSKISIMSGWLVKILNKVDNDDAFAYNDINYSYYYKQTEKLIDSVQRNIKQLELF